MPVKFPPVEAANEDGLLAIGGRLDPETLTLAYKSGIFPWPVSEDFPLTWFAPDPRGIIRIKDFHVSKSLKKFLTKDPFEYHFNRDFEEVINRCAQAKRKHEDGTWINKDIIKAYVELFHKDKAYCVGAYSEGELVGGLYGVCIGEIISGESMFFDEPNASKGALVHLINTLESKGLEFLDTQMVTPVIASFGATKINREMFMELLGRLDSERPRKDIFSS